MKIFNTIIQLRRDNEYNFEPIKDRFIPANGEVVFVDTSKEGLKVKVGDGVSSYAQLPFIGGGIKEFVVQGYFIDGHFYQNKDQTAEIPPMANKMYIDKLKDLLYFYDGTEYLPLSSSFSTASDTEAGIVKLYSTTGQNTDGTMTQKAITNELELRYKANVDSANELLIFSL